MKKFKHLKTFESFEDMSNYDLVSEIEKNLSEEEFDRFLDRITHMSVEEVQSLLKTLQDEKKFESNDECCDEEVVDIIHELPDHLVDRLSSMSVGEIQEMLRNLKQEQAQRG